MTAIVPNTGDFDTATLLTFPAADLSGANWIALLKTAVAADRLLLMIGSDRSHHYHYLVTSEAVDNVTTVDVPVSLIERQGAAITVADGSAIVPQLFPRGIGQALYGSMNLSAAAAGNDLGVVYDPITEYDTVNLPGLGITFDLVAGSMAFATTGVYVVNFLASLNHNSSNSGRVTSMRLFDITAAVPLPGEVRIGIGRNVEDTAIAVSLLVEIGQAEINEAIRAELGNGDIVTSVIWTTLSLAAYSVGG